MKNTFLLICLLFSSILISQSQLQTALKNKNFKEAKRLSELFLESKPNSSTGNLALGKAYIGLKEYDEAIPVLLKSLKNATKNWQLAWANIELAEVYSSIGNFIDAKKYYEKAKQLKGTKNANNTLKKLGLELGFDSCYNSWKTKETENIRFHFQNPTSIKNIENYIKIREEAFKSINKFFESKLPKKIDFFVWSSNEEALKLFKKPLGFALPQYCVAHNKINQSLGHEIAHNISFWANKERVKNRFINEGIAVCFDQNNIDRINIARQIAKTKKIDIKKMWQFPHEYSEKELYPIAGAFITYLISIDKEKFLELNKNQTYKSAQKIYKNKLDEIIINFENKLNN